MVGVFGGGVYDCAATCVKILDNSAFQVPTKICDDFRVKVYYIHLADATSYRLGGGGGGGGTTARLTPPLPAVVAGGGARCSVTTAAAGHVCGVARPSSAGSVRHMHSVCFSTADIMVRESEAGNALLSMYMQCWFIEVPSLSLLSQLRKAWTASVIVQPRKCVLQPPHGRRPNRKLFSGCDTGALQAV